MIVWSTFDPATIDCWGDGGKSWWGREATRRKWPQTQGCGSCSDGNVVFDAGGRSVWSLVTQFELEQDRVEPFCSSAFSPP